MLDILSVENKSVLIDDIEEDDDNFRFSVLDYSDENYIDFQFIPLLYLESYSKSVMEVTIGKNRVRLPSDWSIVIADKQSGTLELLELDQINNRVFDVFVFNPITGFIPKFEELTSCREFPPIKWIVPKLKYGHLLSVPVQRKDNPDCILIAKDIHKLPETLDIGHMV